MHTVTEIQIQPIKPNNGLIAFASVVIDGSLYLGSIGIHKKLRDVGYRLTYPTKKIAGSEIHIHHPINKKISRIIEQAIFKKVGELI